MKFGINRDALQSALDKVVAASDGAKLPPFVVVEGSGTKLSFFTTGNHIALKVQMSAVTPHEPFKIGVLAKSFREIVQSLKEKEIFFELSATGCKIRTKASSFKLNILTPQSSPMSFVSEPEFERLPYQPTNFAEFFDAAAKVIYCAEEKEPRHDFTRGLIIEPGGFYGTDRIRLARMPNACVAVDRGILLPLRAVKNLLKIYGDLRGEGGFYLSDTRVFFVNSGVFSSVRLLGEKIPPVASAIPLSHHSKRMTLKAELIPALKRSMILADGKVPIASLSFSGETLTIRSEANGNASEEVIACSPAPENFQTHLNLRYVLDAVMVIDDEMIRFELRPPLNGTREQAVIICDLRRTHLNVILPVTVP